MLTKAQHKVLLADARKHALAAEFIRGKYWSNGKGCDIGCAVMDCCNRGLLPKGIAPDSHKSLAELLGIPIQVAYLRDYLFEKSPDGLNHPVRFMEAYKPGADYSGLFHEWCVRMLTRVIVNADATGKPAIQTIIDLHKQRIPIGDSRWSAAGSAAWSAAGSAAGSAWSARSAAESAAWSAAGSAESARSAAGSAWSAWSARSAAGSAWSARSAAESAWSARSAAESAAWSAAGSAESAWSAWSAAGSAAWSAAGSAWSARSAAESAWSAAWSAAGSAAESAAWSAAWSAAGSARSAEPAELALQFGDLCELLRDAPMFKKSKQPE